MSYSDNEFKKIALNNKNLESISPSFCLVRWKHATLNLASGASKSCCHHDFKPIDFKKKYKQLHDNEAEQKLRKKMIEGEKVKDCSYCWWIEDNGHTSDRQSWSAKSWMAPFFEETKKNLSEQATSPSWLELNFSSVCNLKCVYCSPIFSTKWYQEIKKFGPYPTETKHNDISGLNHIEHQDNYDNVELMNQFWPWFDDILPTLRLLKLTGGEPLLSSHTFKMLDMIASQKNPQVSLGVNSNLSVDANIWNNFINKIQLIEKNKSIDRFYLHPSIDCFGKRAEYIRYGLDFSKFQANVQSYLEQTSSHLHFICTLNNLALGSLKELWEYILILKRTYFKEGREIAIGTEILQYPSWLNINILPQQMIKFIDDTIDFVEKNLDESGRGFSQVELEGLQKARSSFLSQADDVVKAKSDFKIYVAELDRRRNTDFFKIFPELSSW